jgi:hypothetical protein
VTKRAVSNPGKYFLATRYVPPGGGRVIAHVYGPFETRSKARTAKAEMVAQIAQDDRGGVAEYHICQAISDDYIADLNIARPHDWSDASTLTDEQWDSVMRPQGIANLPLSRTHLPDA